MSAALPTDREAYAEALRAYLASGGEEALQTAFRIGREVIQQGKGVMALVEVHAEALRVVMPELLAERGYVAISGESCRFLAESLASFEMMLLGAREVNESLQRMNETLEERVEQRAQELERERSRFQEVIAHNPAALYAFRLAPTREYVYVSPQVERLFGFPLEDWTHELAEAQIHEEDILDVKVALENALLGGGQYAANYRMRTRGGRTLFIHDRGHVMKSDDGEVVLHGVMTDATEQEELQQQLFHAQKMEAIGRLAGGVAHDFNNLLTVILSFGRLLMDELADSDPRAEDLREILRAADSASQLTNQLLAFSRRQVVEPRIIDPTEALTQLEKMVRRTLSEEVALVTRYEAGPRYVKIDPGQLDQVVLNLVVNARDAMPRGGTLRIGLRDVDLPGDEQLPAGRYVELSVADTGVGMSAEVRERVFEPFFTTKGTRGTGLGLSTCFGIVRQAGGDLRVDSQPGRGTLMRVLLPALDRDSAAFPRDDDEVPIGGSGHVLIAEDQPAILRVLARVLRNAGYRVTTAAHAEEAFDVVARGERIDLLLTDIALPGMSGLALVRQVRAERPRLPVLIMTGYSQLEEGHPDTGLLESLPVLMKPFTPSQLLTRIYELLLSHGERGHE